MKHLLTQLGVYTSSPVAFLVLILYAALWYVFKPETFEWHAGATLATWAMTLLFSAPSIATPKPSTRSWMKYCTHLVTPEMKSLGSMRRSLRRSSDDASTCARTIKNRTRQR